MLPITYLNKRLSSNSQQIFLSDTQTELTCVQLRQVISCIAYSILARKTTKNKQIAVAILLSRNVYYIASMFAIWKTGGYFIPLNTRWPETRIQEVIEHCQADIVICHKDGVYHGKKALYLEDIDFESKLEFDEQKACATGLSDLAYVIYTSGSTGTPKGVIITHESYGTYIDWTQRYFADYQNNQRLLISVELTFDITMGDIAFALAFGTAIYLAPDPANIMSLYKILNKFDIDTFYSVPTTHTALFEFASKKRNADLSTLKLVISAGDTFSVDLIKKIKAVADNAHFYNLYGPTEVTISCFSTRVDNIVKHIEEKGRIPIGRAFDVISFAILDENEEKITAFNQPGRLCVTGLQVMRGYFNNPDATADAFVVDPRYPELNRKLYNTGDLAFYDEDGMVYLMGRTDNLVKVKGYRIHPDEITNALLKLEGINEAVTVVMKAKTGNYLKAFVTLSKPLSIEEIQSHLKAMLPGYMVPGEIEILKKMPLNDSGKIDRLVLKDNTSG